MGSIREHWKIILVFIALVFLVVIFLRSLSNANFKAIFDESFKASKTGKLLTDLQKWEIVGDAMLPGYKNGQQWAGEKISNVSELKASTVIIHTSTNDASKQLIKRIVALPGDTVKIEGGKFFVNGNELIELYLYEQNMTYPGNFMSEGEEKTTPENSYFVLGDNRQYSADSREYGFVPGENIIGKLTICLKDCK